jgi:prevent-host-death family protein
MKTVTIREAQRHLSKLVNEVRESGREIDLTRRGEEVCKITPIKPKVEEKPDWAAWTKEQRKFLAAMPMTEGSAMDADREGYRW